MSLDMASERVCYVDCNFCNTVLAVLAYSVLSFSVLLPAGSLSNCPTSPPVELKITYLLASGWKFPPTLEQLLNQSMVKVCRSQRKRPSSQSVHISTVYSLGAQQPIAWSLGLDRVPKLDFMFLLKTPSSIFIQETKQIKTYAAQLFLKD